VQSRTVCLLVAVMLAGCGGGGPKSDADAVSEVLKNAAKAVAGGDGDKACGYLTPDAQRQAQLQVGGGVPLGQSDCPTLVKRATAFMSPLDRKQIESLEPSNVQVNGTSASATLATQAGATAGQGISVQLNLQKVGSDWKISGFANASGLPGA
jgi:hypothetical protein